LNASVMSGGLFTFTGITGFLYHLSLIVHITIPCLLVIAGIVYLRHEYYAGITGVHSDTRFIIVRVSCLFLSAIFIAGYLGFYVHVTELTCDVTTKVFQALPAVSKFCVHLFYGYRYLTLATKLKLHILPGRIFFVLAIITLVVGWIPYLLATTLVADGLCVPTFSPSALQILGIFMVLDIGLGLIMLYMFFQPVSEAAKYESNMFRTTNPNLKNSGDTTKSAPDSPNERESQAGMNGVLRKAFLSSGLSLVSTLLTSIALGLALFWVPELSILFLSDIASAFDASVNCLILLYSHKDFKIMYHLPLGSKNSVHQSGQGTRHSNPASKDNKNPMSSRQSVEFEHIKIELPAEKRV